jgi:hypothetical protein
MKATLACLKEPTALSLGETERRGQVVNTSASYSGCPGHRVQLNFLLVLSVPPHKLRDTSTN